MFTISLTHRDHADKPPTMIFEHTNYREFLRSELVTRIQKNPQFSLRSLARRIGISPGLLSSVLNGRKNLSRETAHLTAEALGLREKESEYFQLLVDLAKIDQSEIRSNIQKRLESLAPPRKSKRQEVSLDHFKLISEWYHYPILELSGVTGFQLKPQAIAKSLGITIHESKSALSRLVRLGLITKDAHETYSRSVGSCVSSAAVPSPALRKFHRQMLEKAMESLETQTPNEKLVGSETLAFSEKALPEAGTIIEECFEKLLALSNRLPRKDHVYHLGIQFFRLTQSRQEKKKS